MTPQLTCLVPLRRRTQFTSNALPSLLRGMSRPDHEILILLDRSSVAEEIAARPEMYPPPVDRFLDSDKDDCLRVDKWFKAHKKLLAPYNVQVVNVFGPPGLWTGGMRCAHALNTGLAMASHPWVLGLVDEDLVFQPGWDEKMWAAMEGRDHTRTCVVPTMVMPKMFSRPVEAVDSAWLEGQRMECCHQLTMPLLDGQDDKSYRVTYEQFDAFCRSASKPGVWEEPCGARQRCHWVPVLLHVDLARAVGGWPTDTASAHAFDIVFDNKLGELGVIKRMPQDHFVLHTKHHIYTDAETEKAWVDPSWAGRLLPQEVR